MKLLNPCKKFGKKYYYDLTRPLDDIRLYYDFDGTCQRSVPEAIIAYLEASDFETAIRNTISLGGDADTLACIAGGIAEAYYGEIPVHIKKFCDIRIDSTIRLTVNEFEEKYRAKK